MGFHSQLNPLVCLLIPSLPYIFIHLLSYLFLLLFCKYFLCVSLVLGLVYWENLLFMSESYMVRAHSVLKDMTHVYKSQSTREDEVRVTIEG